MEVITNFFKQAIAWLEVNVYNPASQIWTDLFHGKAPFDFKWVAIGLGALILLLLLIAIFSPKKVKIIFNITKNKQVKIKCKYKKTIKYPKIKAPEGKRFEGWYKDKAFTELYDSYMLDTKKTLNLYAKFVSVNEEVANTVVTNAVEAPVEPIVNEPVANNVVSANQPEPVAENVKEPISAEAVAVAENVKEPISAEPVAVAIAAANNGVVEESINEIPSILSAGEIYDNIRYTLLSYERTKAFSKVGVVRKQFIAEMFEKNGKIYLYLAIDPDAMLAKGYNVEKFSEREFSVVPCKKVILNSKDYQEALDLIEETMLFNNLVKSETAYVKKVVSDEQARRSGFAFFIKNEYVATTADDYYKLLRASTNCYTVSPKAKNLGEASNKMILKMFKKEDEVYLYLALDADKEGLDFVGYDRNFVDTPAMFVIKTADDFNKANVLIDKLMTAFEMEKHPEKAELSLEEPVQKNCGYGYRIRF